MNARSVKALIMALVFSFAALAPIGSAIAAIRYGDSGQQVIEIQRKLRQWGYYTGSIDGKFGSQTLAAVKRFQRVNGLTVDGIVGPKTAAALGITLTTSSSGSSSSSSSGNVYLLARIIYGEGRGEPYKGQVAIGAVVLNRVKNSSFPNTMAGVIYQGGAFDAVSDGQINLSPDATAIRAARDALNGWDPTNGCLYYYNPATATSRWMLSRPILLRIGNHAFC